jgi:HK97 gp10 family phage protein|nr:MAG TPA: putative tail component [Caudoviricetes sp.]
MKIKLEDHSDEVLEALESACQRALEKCGLVGEGYAKNLCPVDTGNLRNSITHMVNDGEKAAYVGTNSEYGVYVECGTGIYYPGGRQTPWTYQDENGDWHLTHGQRAKPYIKPAVADHAAQYTRIIKQELKGE